MAPKPYAELKKQVEDLTIAEGVLKAEIERLKANPGADGSDEAKAALEAKAKAEAEAAELQKQIDALTAEVSALKAETPEVIKLVRPYAFYDEEGNFHAWEAGEIKDPAVIELLMDRGVI